MSRHLTLFNSCDTFLKNAGLIKTPKAISNTLTAWALSIYCQKLANDYLKEYTIPAMQQRAKTWMAAARSVKDKWNAFNNFANHGYSFDKIATPQGAFTLTVPFWAYGKDPITGLQGTVDRNAAPRLYLSLHKSDPAQNKIQLFLSIDGHEISNYLLSERSVRDLLAKDSDDIYKQCHNFVRFADDPAEYRGATEKDFAEIKRLLIVCNSHIKKEYSQAQDFTFPTSQILTSDIAPQMLGVKDISIRAIFASTKEEKSQVSREDWKGTWDEKLNTSISKNEYNQVRQKVSLGRLGIGRDLESDLEIIMTTYGQSKFQTLNDILADIAETVRHETDHLYQTFVNYITQNSVGAGLPGKNLREKNYNQFGALKSNPLSPRIQHPLQDIEFYTNLADSVALFKQNRTKLPLYLQHQYLKCWISQDLISNFNPGTAKKIIEFKTGKPPNLDQINNLNQTFNALMDSRVFFEQLKLYQPLKYKKAVKEFVKAVGY